METVGADMGAKHWNKPPVGALRGGEVGPWHKAGRSVICAQERILLCTLLDDPRLGLNGSR
jgi:hypothetical protein